MAVASDGRCTIKTPRNTANDPTRVQSVGGGSNADTGNIAGVRVLGVALDGLTGDVREYLWDAQIVAAIYLRDVTQPDVDFPIENETRTLTEFMSLAARETRRGVTRGLRTARDRGERKIYILARNLHWRVLLVDSTKKQLYTFDPLGCAFKDTEMEATLRVFPDHDHIDLDLKVQSDVVNCGAWVVWMSWIWLTEEARNDPDFRGVVQAAMLSGRPIIRDLREMERTGGHDDNVQAMVQLRRHLRERLDKDSPRADQTLLERMRTLYNADFFRQAPARTAEERREEVRRGKRPVTVEEAGQHHKHDTPQGESTPTEPLTHTKDKGSTSGIHKNGGPGGTGSKPAPTGPTLGREKVAPTKGKTTGHIAKKPRGNNIAGRLAKAAKLTHKLATYFAAPMEAPAHTGEHQPYPVYEQRPPPMGVPDRDRWERSENLRERREEARDEERRKREAEKEQNTCTGGGTIDKTRRWARQEEDLEEGQPITMATWNCCSLRTANNTIAGQTDLDRVLEDTGAH
eukprot:1175395-Prorocentrum_minimum.AAC.1